MARSLGRARAPGRPVRGRRTPTVSSAAARATDRGAVPLEQAAIDVDPVAGSRSGMAPIAPVAPVAPVAQAA
ncbi:hypothetical protein FRAAL3279 [Frankia alni ACN14a]|uniref:Uncharacterized protein n=1 Tax=Frankia alni (strain DSM 45986 / CECT 9034 / ACN14a) TaxID=326424 RepID=Q0RKN3_FRAAA|nr:hypothetical protein FRAAL3279 [Frankia alni ACN14a]